MKSYLIVYQLTLSESAYGSLVAYLKTAPYWARPLPSTWFIKTTTEVSLIRDGIMRRINNNDKVLVMEINKASWATFNISKEVTDWIRGSL